MADGLKRDGRATVDGTDPGGTSRLNRVRSTVWFDSSTLRHVLKEDLKVEKLNILYAETYREKAERPRK